MKIVLETSKDLLNHRNYCYSIKLLFKNCDHIHGNLFSNYNRVQYCLKFFNWSLSIFLNYCPFCSRLWYFPGLFPKMWYFCLRHFFYCWVGSLKPYINVLEMSIYHSAACSNTTHPLILKLQKTECWQNVTFDKL